MANFDIAQVFSAILAMEGNQTLHNGTGTTVPVTPEMFSEMLHSPFLDGLPMFVAMPPKVEYFSSTIVFAQFPVRVERGLDGPRFLVSPKSLHAAERGYTSSQALVEDPFGVAGGICRVAADAAALLTLTPDPTFGVIPMPTYRQARKNPSDQKPRGFSVKFSRHAARDASREAMIANDQMRGQIAEALCGLKDRIGVYGNGTIIVSLLGFASDVRNITRSKTEEERQAEKVKYGNMAADNSVGVSLPEGGFILTAQPAQSNAEIGFAHNRIHESVQSEYRQKMMEMMKASGHTSFIPGKVQKSAPVVPQAPVIAPPVQSTGSVDPSLLDGYKKLGAGSRLSVLGKMAAGKYGSTDAVTNQLRILFKACQNGAQINDAFIAQNAPKIRSVAGLIDLRDRLFVQDPASARNLINSALAGTGLPAPVASVAPAPVAPAPVAPAPAPVAPAPAAPAPAAPALDTSLLSFMASAGAMEEGDTFSPVTVPAPVAVPAPVTVPTATNGEDALVAKAITEGIIDPSAVGSGISLEGDWVATIKPYDIGEDCFICEAEKDSQSSTWIGATEVCDWVSESDYRNALRAVDAIKTVMKNTVPKLPNGSVIYYCYDTRLSLALSDMLEELGWNTTSDEWLEYHVSGNAAEVAEDCPQAEVAVLDSWD